MAATACASGLDSRDTSPVAGRCGCNCIYAASNAQDERKHSYATLLIQQIDPSITFRALGTAVGSLLREHISSTQSRSAGILEVQSAITPGCHIASTKMALLISEASSTTRSAGPTRPQSHPSMRNRQGARARGRPAARGRLAQVATTERPRGRAGGDAQALGDALDEADPRSRSSTNGGRTPSRRPSRPSSPARRRCGADQRRRGPRRAPARRCGATSAASGRSAAV